MKEMGAVLRILAVAALAVPLLSAASRQPREPVDDALVHEGSALFTRVWTVADGLGPTFNARSCSGCHSIPFIGGSGTEPRTFVVVTPALPIGSHVFRRLRIDATGAVSEMKLPRNGVVRKAPALLGSGFIDAVPESEIGGTSAVGRFGWKGRFRNIEEAIEAAFENELGLNDGEISGTQIRAVSAFIRSLSQLAVPETRGPVEDRGHVVFQQVGCGSCHRPSFPSLERQGLFPYTDLRLHDMGPALADGIQERDATSTEFKTPPLWGIARTGPPYLHDGRAASLDDAIAGHAGEAESVIKAWEALSSQQKADLRAFLRSL